MTCLTAFFHSLQMTQKFIKAIAFVGTKICAAAFKKYSGGTYGRSVDTVVRGFSLFTIINSPGISRAFACELLHSIRGIVLYSTTQRFLKKKHFEHPFSAVEVSHGTQQPAGRLASSRSMDALKPQCIPVQARTELSWCRTNSHCTAIMLNVDVVLSIFKPGKMGA